MLRQFIRLILEAESINNNSAEVQEINNLFKQIVNKFPNGFFYYRDLYDGLNFYALGSAIADDKNQTFWDRYNSDKTFKRFVLKSNIYRRVNFNISFLNAKAFNEYLKDELKYFDVLAYFNLTLHQISYEKLTMLLRIAKNYDEFELLVKKIAKEV